MTSLTERVPLDRIERRARHARPGRVLLTLLAGLLFALGWTTCKAFALTWLAVAWCGSAVAEGWISARSGQEAP